MVSLKTAEDRATFLNAKGKKWICKQLGIPCPKVSRHKFIACFIPKEDFDKFIAKLEGFNHIPSFMSNEAILTEFDGRMFLIVNQDTFKMDSKEPRYCYARNLNSLKLLKDDNHENESQFRARKRY